MSRAHVYHECECGHVHDDPTFETWFVCPSCDDHTQPCQMAPGEVLGCDTEPYEEESTR